MQYNTYIMDHFNNPRNIGELHNADGVGEEGDPSCGDHVKVWIRVSSDYYIEDISYRCQGCPVAIALGSIMTEMAKSLYLDDAWEQITDEAILEQAGDIPEEKRHCSNLAAGALHKAIMNYVVKPI